MDMSAESMRNLTQTYREKALDTFVRGLKGDLPRLLSIKEPTDLPQALHLCTKLQNIDFRVHYANNNNTPGRKYNATHPPVPPRRVPATQTSTGPRRPFFPELYHNPRPQQNPQYQHQQYQSRQFQNNFRTFPPKPLPKPEPMDVDHSIHSRAVNYQNRPKSQFVAQKRINAPNSNQVHVPNKYQRIFNTEQRPDKEDSVNNQMDDQTDQTERQELEYYDQTMTEYIDAQDNSYDQLEILDDINFLD